MKRFIGGILLLRWSYLSHRSDLSHIESRICKFSKSFHILFVLQFKQLKFNIVNRAFVNTIYKLCQWACTMTVTVRRTTSTCIQLMKWYFLFKGIWEQHFDQCLCIKKEKGTCMLSSRNALILHCQVFMSK